MAEASRRGRGVRFLVVGASGLAVNEAAMAVGVELGGFGHLLAAVIATQCSTAWNYALSEGWAFRGHGGTGRWWKRAARYFLVNELALLARGPVLLVLTAVGLHYLVANLITLAALAVIRFLVADSWIFPAQERRIPAATNAATTMLENNAKAVSPS